MKQKKRVIDDVVIFEDCPTDLSFEDLYTWVIWQFPRARGSWHCGAIRPPIANHGWLPALINPSEKSVQIQDHGQKLFKSPGEVLEWLVSAKKV